VRFNKLLKTASEAVFCLGHLRDALPIRNFNEEEMPALNLLKG